MGASVNGNGKASREHPGGMRRVRVTDGGPFIRSFATRRNVLRLEMSDSPAYGRGEGQGSKGAVSLGVCSAVLAAGGRSLRSKLTGKKLF